MNKAGTVGRRANGRQYGAAGVKKRSGEDPLLACAMKMVENVSSMTEAINSTSSKSLESLVRQEVHLAMKDTNQATAAIHDTLEQIAKRLPE